MTSAMQNLLIFLGLIGLAVFAYYLLVVQNDSTLNSSASELTDVESRLFLRQLNELKSINLQTDIFTNPDFRNLENQSASINPQPIGRDNPFVPQN